MIKVELIDINEPPELNYQFFTISENSPNGQQVGTVLASDPDNGQSLTYSINAGNANNAFQIGSSTGILKVNNSLALNFENLAYILLVVKVQDNGIGNLACTGMIKVILNDINEPPQLNNQNFSIQETRLPGNKWAL